ncbi:uncharacterized protein CcaverHIS019_0309210 [Cutaneotrichosporon cavernicola]|uniref:SWIM-type domain-containing protein n=1 Tax=Cutaneotrichosporon cavernicola TaxID=279322 RepID=A0AA48I498_9TREE|nr:uncharacterized protein CcaverHIS019_0309210 [Cutaneotrichosporon cavernicola]BEI90851.1 hypothetical protein CcaverHIS019_0309210 [Cutaneotrichosporon cavernicola]BEI98630.1 hypothetical protein CcaverHIS631_0309290 [Cutaneotrichosporon cavernicola]BEJ06399.1 hypothetical protein CcaverHIS641_0309210 [Cutaneotrichosporon cavernicola]
MTRGPLRHESLMDPHIFTSSGEYVLPEAAIIAKGNSLWADGNVSLDHVPDTRMPEMAATVAVQDEDGTWLAGFKPNGDEYCSCIPNRRDPRRCPHLWAMITAVQAQRSLPKVTPRPSTPDVFRPSSPLFHIPRPLALTLVGPQILHRSKPDTLGLGVVELLARAGSFVHAFRAAFDKVFIETLTPSLLAQLFRSISRGFWVDYANVFTALKADHLLDKMSPEPTELLQRIITHCDRSAGTTTLRSLLQWEAEAFVRCTKCSLLTFGPSDYLRWRASVYPGAVATNREDHDAAPALDQLLDLSLFDTTHTHCIRCKTRTLHVVKHTPLVLGRLLLIRIVPDADPGSLFVPHSFTDSVLGHKWNLVGMLSAHGEGYNTIIAEDSELFELVGGMRQPHPLRGLPAPPVLVLYERQDEGEGASSDYE